MPEMIPPEISDDAPMSEKIIFENLKSAPHARNWVVFHSQCVKNPKSLARPREIDFVILNADNCSIICIEAKGGGYEIDEGRWYRLPQRVEVQPPPQQSRSAMFALKDEFDSHFAANSLLSLGCAVAFTDGQFPKGVRLPQEALIIDRYVARDANKLGNMLKDYATELPPQSVRTLLSTNPEKSREALESLDQLRTTLEGSGEVIEPDKIDASELTTYRALLLRLTTNQLNSLKLTEQNHRCVIDGAAGTGKTVLAMELAKQRCDEGEIVALLCSNRNLSERFDAWAGNFWGAIVAGTPATLPLRAFSEDSVFADPTFAEKHQRRLENSPNLEGSLKSGYLDDQWEQFVEDTVENLSKKGIFDYLIVDEAQNLCDPVFLKLMDALLKDGLAGGRWTMFGDFTHQDIVYPTELGRKGTDVLEDFGLYWANDRLETNCRNTEEIATKIAMLVDIEAPPRSGVYGPDVQIEYFNSPEDLENLLDNLLSDWQNANFHPGQIILLSSGIGNEFDTEREYAGWKPRNIREISEADFKYAEGVVIPGDSSLRNTLRYSDVYDFQGLESDVVILVLPIAEDTVVLEGGITLPREKHLNRLLYTGMSRAKAMLVVVAHENYQGTLKSREALYDILKPSKKP